MVRLDSLAEYPYVPKTVRIGVHTMACLDEGEGMPLVMVHGNPSWSYLYRNVVSALRDTYRCIVPDHLGCGLSDKPADYPYRLQDHIDNLAHLLERLQVGRCLLMVHDWGGPIGLGWAGRRPEQVAGLVILNTAAFPASRIPLRIAVCRWPVLGTLLVRGLNGFARSATFMAVAGKMSRQRAAGFLAPYDSWANRVAIHRFVQDIPMHAGHPSWATLKRVEAGLSRLQKIPTLICWGGRDFCFDNRFFQEWRQRFPAAESHLFPHAGHYLLEDALADILPLLSSFLQRCLTRRSG